MKEDQEDDSPADFSGLWDIKGWLITLSIIVLISLFWALIKYYMG